MYINENKVGNFRIFLACIVFIINSGYALTSGNAMFCILISLAYLIFDISLCPFSLIKKNNNLYWFLGLFIIFCGISFLVNFDINAWKEYARIILLAMCAFRIFTSFSLDKLIYAFIRIMRISVIISLIFFFAIQILPVSIFPKISNGYGVTYYTCFLSSVDASFYNIRNSGLFWEAGMFAAFTAIWMLCEIFYTTNKFAKWGFFLIGIFAIVTSNSTSGYVYILILILCLLVKSIKKLTIVNGILFVLIAIIVGYIIVNYNTIIDELVAWKPEVFGKLKEETASVTDRFYGPIADMYLALRNPFGVGFGNVTEQVVNIGKQLFKVEIESRTSSLTFYFATLGMGGFIVLIPFCRLFKVIGNNFILKFLSMLLLFWITFSTPLNNTIFLYILLFIGVSYNKNNDICINHKLN